MNRDAKILLRGIGTGMILTAILFFAVGALAPRASELPVISDTEIIRRAEALGMVFEETKDVVEAMPEDKALQK